MPYVASGAMLAAAGFAQSGAAQVTWLWEAGLNAQSDLLLDSVAGATVTGNATPVAFSSGVLSANVDACAPDGGGGVATAFVRAGERSGAPVGAWWASGHDGVVLGQDWRIAAEEGRVLTSFPGVARLTIRSLFP